MGIKGLVDGYINKRICERHGGAENVPSVNELHRTDTQDYQLIRGRIRKGDVDFPQRIGYDKNGKNFNKIPQESSEVVEESIEPKEQSNKYSSDKKRKLYYLKKSSRIRRDEQELINLLNSMTQSMKTYIEFGIVNLNRDTFDDAKSLVEKLYEQGRPVRLYVEKLVDIADQVGIEYTPPLPFHRKQLMTMY